MAVVALLLAVAAGFVTAGVVFGVAGVLPVSASALLLMVSIVAAGVFAVFLRGALSGRGSDADLGSRAHRRKGGVQPTAPGISTERLEVRVVTYLAAVFLGCWALLLTVV